ncbi:hypothetical protein PoMZ_02583 [Pyricularia oryzae]|uniref:Uncharacterized protein n=1 Tax=Pyricularia oryzae TaxID=318829 RepID=A0A4P7N554_PYROR|nr:hypothetical protein PoMZ_02583 [Pyricularia oryzae]
MEYNIILDNLKSKFAILNISNIFIKKTIIPPFGFVTPISISAFFDYYTAVVKNWTTLLKHILLPKIISNSNPRIPIIFIIINHIINGGLYLFSKFAWVKFFRFIKSVENIIKNERRLDFVKRTPGYGNANIVANIYMRFYCYFKKVVYEYKRKTKRWIQLAGPSLLLLLAFSTIANSIM